VSSAGIGRDSFAEPFQQVERSASHSFVRCYFVEYAEGCRRVAEEHAEQKRPLKALRLKEASKQRLELAPALLGEERLTAWFQSGLEAKLGLWNTSRNADSKRVGRLC
jgi:hypothetical protein